MPECPEAMLTLLVAVLASAASQLGPSAVIAVVVAAVDLPAFSASGW